MVEPRNSLTDLHPIGSHAIYPVLHSATWTDSNTVSGPVYWEYEVAGHVLTADWPGDLAGTWKEQLRPTQRVVLE